MGNKSTYIENGTSETIWVRCDTDRASVEIPTFESEENDSAVYIGNGVGLRGEQGNDWPRKRAEFCQLPPQGSKKFTFFDSGKSTIYITIVAANGEIIANAIRKPIGIHYVVKERETSKTGKPRLGYKLLPPIPNVIIVKTDGQAKPEVWPLDSDVPKNWVSKKREVSQWVSRSERPGDGYWVFWIWTPEQGWRSYRQ